MDRQMATEQINYYSEQSKDQLELGFSHSKYGMSWNAPIYH